MVVLSLRVGPRFSVADGERPARLAGREHLQPDGARRTGGGRSLAPSRPHSEAGTDALRSADGGGAPRSWRHWVAPPLASAVRAAGSYQEPIGTGLPLGTSVSHAGAGFRLGDILPSCPLAGDGS